jgi:hypothetical protein
MVLMTSLEVLKVSHNLLKDRIEPIPYLSHLKSLHLSANGITHLPPTMSNLHRVKVFLKFFSQVENCKKLDFFFVFFVFCSNDFLVTLFKFGEKRTENYSFDNFRKIEEFKKIGYFRE